MTLTMFYQREDSALILTDTLVTSHEGASPVRFASKVTALPHMNMALCVMGPAQFSWLWEAYATHELVGIRDIDELNAFAPEVLRAFWAEFAKDAGASHQVRVCHVGFPTGTDRIVRYSYESDNEFAPERIDTPGLWTQPLPQNFTIDRWADRDDIIDVADRIREESPDRIGGDLHATLVENGSIRMMTWHRFPGYEDMRQQMLRATQPQQQEEQS